MSARERTLQHWHPLGTLASRPITIVAAVVLPVYAVVMTWFNRDDIIALPLAVASIFAIIGSSVTIVLCSSPLRAPFPQHGPLIALLFGMAALQLSVASMWMANQFVRDDWAATALGVILLALAPYRSPRYLVIAGSVSALFVAIVVVAEAKYFVTDVPIPVFVDVQVAPVLAMSLGAAAFSSSLVRGLERWQRHANSAVSALDESRNDWIARSVQQDHVTILNQDVVPFFAGLLSTGTVTAEDAVRAREVAESIRSVMVAEVDRTWLEGVVEQSATAVGLARRLSADVIDDRTRLAQRLATDQRTAIRALIVALFAHPDFVPSSLRIVIEPLAGRSVVTVRAAVDCSESRMRSELAPYFAVIRILFGDARVAFTQPALQLRFSYEQ